MWGAARVLVAGAAFFEKALLRAEVRATPQCKREAAPWTRGAWESREGREQGVFG